MKKKLDKILIDKEMSKKSYQRKQELVTTPL